MLDDEVAPSSPPAPSPVSEEALAPGAPLAVIVDGGARELEGPDGAAEEVVGEEMATAGGRETGGGRTGITPATVLEIWCRREG